MKPILLAALLIPLLYSAGQQPRDVRPSTTPIESTTQKGEADHPQAKCDASKNQKSTKTVAIGDFKKRNIESKTSKTDPYNESHSILYRASLLATIGGVIVGLIGLGFIWRQFNLAKLAANATKESAEGFKNSERAWIIVDIKSTEKSSEGVEFVGQGSTSISISNYGKTPAKIKQVFVRSDKLQNASALDNLSLSKDDRLASLENTLVGLTAPREEGYYIPVETIKGGSGAGQETVFIWGVVCYEDIYHRQLYTRFLYKCSPRSYREPILVERVLFGRYNEYGEGDCEKAIGNPPSEPANI